MLGVSDKAFLRCGVDRTRIDRCQRPPRYRNFIDILSGKPAEPYEQLKRATRVHSPSDYSFLLSTIIIWKRKELTVNTSTHSIFRFVAQLVERPTSIWEARVQAPSKPEFFSGFFFCNFFNCSLPARINSSLIIRRSII